MKKQIRKSLILQMVTISFLGYLESQEEQAVFIHHLRNLMSYVHSNFLLLIQYIMDRFPPETLAINVWAEALSTIIQQKMK